MGVRNHVSVCALLSAIAALSACGSAGQSVKSVGGLPQTGSIPNISLLPGGTLPDISLPSISIPKISIPDITGLTIPKATTLPPATGAPSTKAPSTNAPATDAPATPAPVESAAVTIAGGGQVVSVDGMTVVIPPDFALGSGGNAPSLPTSGTTVDYTSPSGNTVIVGSTTGTLAMYKQIFANQATITTKDTTVDGHPAVQISTGGAGSVFVFDYLIIQGSGDKIFLLAFVGTGADAAATEAAIFQTIKIAG